MQHGDEAANASISSTADFLARRRQRNRGQAQTGSAAEYGDPLPSNQQQQFDYGDDDDDDDDDDYGGGAGGGMSATEAWRARKIWTRRASKPRRPYPKEGAVAVARVVAAPLAAVVETPTEPALFTNPPNFPTSAATEGGAEI